MQPRSGLKKRLRAFADVVLSEALDNPAFAARLEAALTNTTSTRPAVPQNRSRRREHVLIPDVFEALKEKGDEEFGFWLRTLDTPTLKAIVKQNGFDPAKLSARWKDSDKHVELIREQTRLRLRRGVGFLPPKDRIP